MGRRGIEVTEAQRWVFNRLARHYVHRPSYPEALIARVATLAREHGERLVDVGAGVGHLAIRLAERGLAVTAVEPAQEMLAVLAGEASKRGLPIRLVHAAAEKTGLPAVSHDGVLVADAVHWIDVELAGRELGRLLAPGGVCMVVEAELVRTPFMEALLALIQQENPKARHVRRDAASELVRRVTGRGRATVERFTHELVLDDVALEGTLRSFSFIGPALGEERVAALVDEARRLAVQHGGATWRRELVLGWASTCR